MKRIKIVKNRVAALCLSMFLALGLIAPALTFEAKAEALPQVLESSSTIADCVMTYYAMSGSAIANTEWINTLYNSLGSNFGTIGEFAEQGLMEYVDGAWQPVEQLAQNISNTSAYTKLGLDSVFNVSAEEVANGGGYAVATGASTLAGAAGCVASNGILPVLGGVTAAYWGGIAVGTLINHIIDYAGKAITNGNPITASEYLNSLSSGVGTYAFSGPTDDYIFSSSGSPYGVLVNSSNLVYIVSKNGSNDSVSQYKVWNLTGNRLSESGNLYFVSGVSAGKSYAKSNYKSLPYDFTVNDQTAFNNYLAGLRNGTIEPPKKYSPDVIGADGNQYGNYDSDTGKYQVPNMLPQINPETQSGKPLSLDDWLEFANGINNNNNNQTNPIPDNSELFDNILDAVRTIIPNPNPNPDPNPDPDPNPNPDPETVPAPDLNPYPDSYPVADPETVPDNKPQPEYTEKATENETDIIEGDPYTTPDLLNKFPFCIPRDILKVFKKLDSGARQAPHIQWKFNPNNMIDYTFDIDFSTWDSVASLLRLLELAAFIIALGIATRNLILS